MDEFMKRQKQSAVWKRGAHRSVYKGRSQIIVYDVELPNGDRSTYEVDHGESHAAATLIKSNDGQLMLSYQFRFPLNKWVYDLPGGGGRKGETPEETAIRECREEIGIIPKKLRKLLTFYSNPSRTDWPVHVFFCDEYETSTEVMIDPAETVEQAIVSVHEFVKLVDANLIFDPALLLGWYAARDKGFISI